MFAFSSLQFSQSILCWQVRRKMSNKCKESVCEFPPPHSLSINSWIPILAKPARNSLVFTFKAVLSVNSVEPAKQSLRHLLRICRGPAVRTNQTAGNCERGRQIEEMEAQAWFRLSEAKRIGEGGGRERNEARKSGARNKSTKRRLKGKHSLQLFTGNTFTCHEWDYRPSLTVSLHLSSLSLRARSQWWAFSSAKLHARCESGKERDGCGFNRD